MKQKFIIVSLLVALFGFVPAASRAAILTVDFNNDTCYDYDDLAHLRANLGTSNIGVDVDRSGRVDAKDLAYLAKNWAPCDSEGIVNGKELYPTAPGKTLTWVGYNNDGTVSSVYEKTTTIPWEDGKHFTMHRQYGNVGQTAPLCPRTDDVKVWEGDTLYYTDTYYFWPIQEGDPAALTRTVYAPGHPWATTHMIKDQWTEFTEFFGEVYDIQHDNCAVTGETLREGGPVSTRTLVTTGSAWSPYTGGATKPITTIALYQETRMANNPDDLFKEEWQFYKDPQYGYVPIYATIKAKYPGQTADTVLSTQRLERIDQF